MLGQWWANEARGAKMSYGTEYVVLPCTKTDQPLKIFATWRPPTIAKTKQKTGVNFSLFYR